MQGRELDRDARTSNGAFAPRGLADGGNGIDIGFEITLRVGHGARRFAQHVVGIAIAFFLQDFSTLQRLADVAAHDELAAKDFHRLRHRLADHRFAAARHQSFQHALQIVGALVELHDATGQHQGPGRGVDEHRIRFTEMRAEIGIAQFVADELVRRLAVRYAQQGLGEAHQHDAFLGRKLVGMHEGVDATLADAVLAHLLDQAPRARRDPVLHIGRQFSLTQQHFDNAALVGPVMGAQTLAQGIGFGGGRPEDQGHGGLSSKGWRNRWQSSANRP